MNTKDLNKWAGDMRRLSNLVFALAALATACVEAWHAYQEYKQHAARREHKQQPLSFGA